MYVYLSIYLSIYQSLHVGQDEAEAYGSGTATAPTRRRSQKSCGRTLDVVGIDRNM